MLKNMFYTYQNNNPNIHYLEWEKLMRIKAIMMVSTLLTQFTMLEHNQTKNPDYAFYYEFFYNSAFYNTFR